MSEFSLTIDVDGKPATFISRHFADGKPDLVHLVVQAADFLPGWEYLGEVRYELKDGATSPFTPELARGYIGEIRALLDSE